MTGQHTTKPPVDQTGAYLRGLREAAGMTQKDLAGRTGIKQSVISDLELGKASLSWYYCKLLAGAYGMAATDLLPPEILAESRSRLTTLQAQHPDLLGFLARVERLPRLGRQRFNLAMRKLIEMEEEFNASRTTPDAPSAVDHG